MKQEVFRGNLFLLFLKPFLLTVVILGIYFIGGPWPPYMLLFLLLPVLMTIVSLKTKLIIKDDVLHYVKLFKTHEVPLSQVSAFATREVETIEHNIDDHTLREERKIEMLVYVLDEGGGTYFSFPDRLLGLKNRKRFQEVVNAINPDIKVG